MSIRVLHGDDEEVNRTTLKLLALDWTDCVLTQVDSAQQMLEQMQGENFDVFITDGFGNGHKSCLAEFKRKFPKGLSILLSAEDRSNLNLENADVYIQKGVAYKRAEDLGGMIWNKIQEWKGVNDSGERIAF